LGKVKVKVQKTRVSLTLNLNLNLLQTPQPCSRNGEFMGERLSWQTQGGRVKVVAGRGG